MTPIEQWLTDATKGLSEESAARVRAEIEQHHDSARETGDDAIAALGNPRAANRAYRKVLLTEREATMAPVLTQPRPLHLPGLLLAVVFPALVALFMPHTFHLPGFWPVMIVICCAGPLRWLFRPGTLERTRIYGYALGVQDVLLVALVWGYSSWDLALSFGAPFFLLDYYFHRQLLSIFRKLATGQTYSLLPEELRLTHLQAIYLRGLNKELPWSEEIASTVVPIMAAGMALWRPATFAPMAVWVAAAHVTWRIVPFRTEKASRRFRIVKWTAMAIAASSPVLYGARIPWSGAAFMAYLFLIFDMSNLSIRRKLPVAQWPKRLYW